MTTARLGAVVLLGLVASFLPVLAPTPALADAGLEQQFVTSINAERAAAGLAGLTATGDLTTAARRHAATMAAAEHLHHNPALGTAVGGWQKIGENVGRGPEVGTIHQAFMDSPGHRRNVLDPAFTELGIGVVVRDGTIWVTEMFRLPAGAAPAAPEPEATAPEPEATAPEPEATAPEPEPEPTAVTPVSPTPAPTPAPGTSTPQGSDEVTAEPEPAASGTASPSSGSDESDGSNGSDRTSATSEADATSGSGGGAAAGGEPADVPLQQDRMMLVQLRLAVHDA